MWEARSARMNLATSAIRPSSAATLVKTSGSHGFTP